MINKYNVYKVLFFLFAICNVLLVVAFLVMFLTENPINMVFNKKIISFLLLFDLRIILLISFVFLLEVAHRKLTHDSVRNIYKSHKATYLIRRYLHSVEGNEGSGRGREAKIIQKANRSVNTLVIDFKNNTATANIKLASNNESQKVIVEKFDETIDKLNNLDYNIFAFSNFTEKPTNFFQSTATKVK